MWGKLKTKKLGLNELGDIADPADRRILAILFGSRRDLSYAYSPYYRESTDPNFALPAPLWDVVLPLMCASGRCMLRFSLNNNEHLPAVQWDDGAPWEFYLRVAPAEDGAHYRVTGGLRRGDADMPLSKPSLLLAGGLVFYDGLVARLNDHGAFGWISLLRARTELSIPKQDERVDFSASFCVSVNSRVWSCPTSSNSRRLRLRRNRVWSSSPDRVIHFAIPGCGANFPSITQARKSLTARAAATSIKKSNAG